ncbi:MULTISPECIES: glycosyltransferase family 4 protein [unclassified Butyricimonas]|uniref:glycosyltransferase family 4 protein n=1 Tax=unclassified Butyricimonas TaxID=2637652 RepID=UPI000B3AA034|nr:MULTISPECIES: glycosyltransferase family 4 protein [unclassified Butyricimonas]OUN66822.1 hypothetical protein B5G13_00855 [Butyricimonas sp. An62]
MKILYIHQYFVTPEERGGTRSYWIAKELVKCGHEVVVITSRSSIKGYERKKIEGIDVLYLGNNYNNYMSKWQKVKSFLRFVRLSIAQAKREGNVDLVFATSTPLTVGYIALRLKCLKKWRYVFEVRDLWPEFPIQIGAIRNPFVIKFLRFMERKIYLNAEHIIALSPGMKDGVISAGISKSKVTVIPNMSKPDIFYPREKSQDFIKEFSIDVNKFNVIHFGSMGRANGLSYIIETARLFHERSINDVNFIFMGDGATLPLLKELVKKYDLSNVSFLGAHKMSVVSEIVNICDISIVPFLNLPVLYTNSPNKLFDTLSAGKPIIVNSAGWTKDLVEKYDCGFYVDPDSPQDLYKKIVSCKDNKELINQWGRNARRLSIDVFDKSNLSLAVVDILEKCNSNNVSELF